MFFLCTKRKTIIIKTERRNSRLETKKKANMCEHQHFGTKNSKLTVIIGLPQSDP